MGVFRRRPARYHIATAVADAVIGEHSSFNGSDDIDNGVISQNQWLFTSIRRQDEAKPTWAKKLLNEMKYKLSRLGRHFD